jgi:hypothetical protein
VGLWGGKGNHGGLVMVSVPQEAIDTIVAFGRYKGLTEVKIEKAKTGSTYLFLYDPRVVRKGTAFYYNHNDNKDQVKNITLVDLRLLIIFRFADHLPAKIERYINYIVIDKGQVLIYKGRNLLPL